MRLFYHLSHATISVMARMLTVTGLSVTFDGEPAINDLNFELAAGEALAVIGPNGAGKTTTMRILTGYMPPSDGRAKIGGLDVVEHSLEVRRLIGYLPENVPLYPDTTVFGYLKFMADHH